MICLSVDVYTIEEVVWVSDKSVNMAIQWSNLIRKTKLWNKHYTLTMF